MAAPDLGLATVWPPLDGIEWRAAHLEALTKGFTTTSGWSETGHQGSCSSLPPKKTFEVGGLEKATLEIDTHRVGRALRE